MGDCSAVASSSLTKTEQKNLIAMMGFLKYIYIYIYYKRKKRSVRKI